MMGVLRDGTPRYTSGEGSLPFYGFLELQYLHIPRILPLPLE